MALIPSGILGPFSGKVGNLVGCICKNRASYVRTRPLMYHDAKTEAQLRNRATMKTVMAFMSKAKEFAKLTLAHSALGMTTTNVATRMNYHSVRVEGVKDVRMDYRGVRLSNGMMWGLDSALLLREGDALRLRWLAEIENEHSGRMDWVHVFVYNEDRHAEVTIVEACRRGAKMLDLRVPEKWRDEKLHVYVAVSDAKEKSFGNSQYFGFDGRSEGEMKVGDWVKVLGEELMMGVEKGDVTGVAGYEAVGEVDLSKPYRFAGADLSDTRMNSMEIVLAQSAIKEIYRPGQSRIKKGLKKGLRGEKPEARGGNLDDGGGGGA